MDSARILVAMSNDLSSGKMKTILSETGYLVVDQAKDGNECLRKLRTLRPDLVILDYGLSLINGFEVAKVALEDDICDVVIISSPENEETLIPLKQYNSFMSLVKPVNKVALTSTLELMSKNRRKIKELEKEINELKATLDTRKEVERAKGLLMKHLGLTENEAFKRIQKQSMDRGIPMKEIAKAIILAYDI